MPRGLQQSQPTLRGPRTLKKTSKLKSEAFQKLQESIRRHYQKVKFQVAEEVATEDREVRKKYTRRGWKAPVVRKEVRTRYLSVRKMHKLLSNCKVPGEKRNLEQLIRQTLQRQRADPQRRPGDEEWKASVEYFKRSGLSYTDK